MAKMYVDFAGFDEYMKKLEKLGADTQKIAEDALKKGFEIVTEKAEKASHNLPAGGKYSTGRMAASLKTSPEIVWDGSSGSVSVGFNIKKGGLPSIFMMYGTPRYMKVQAMYDAFYSSQTQGEVYNAAKEIFMEALGEME